MKRQKGLLFVLLACCLVATVDAATLTVCPSGCDYNAIGLAIEAANNGDTVYVHNGTYYEHITVNKSINLQGESNTETIINGSGTGTCLTISANYTNVSTLGFSNCPISLISSTSSHNTIENNYLEAGQYGIYETGDLNQIRNNLIFHMTGVGSFRGIYVGGNNNTVLNNTITSYLSVGWDRYGIHVSSSSNNGVLNNTVFINNTWTTKIDILISSSKNTTLTDNNLGGEGVYGVYVEGSSHGTNITDNNISGDNEGYGIHLDSQNVSVNNNTIIGKNAGVYIKTNPVFTIQGNIIKNCTSYGIFWTEGIDNVDVRENNIRYIGDYDLYLPSSTGNTIINNTVCKIYQTETNTVQDNNCPYETAPGITLNTPEDNNVSLVENVTFNFSVTENVDEAIDCSVNVYYPSTLVGSYYNDTSFSELIYEINETQIYYEWGEDPPNSSMADDFSIQWNGTFYAPYSETYTFYINLGYNDYISFTIDGSGVGSSSNFNQNYNLQNGFHNISINYRDHSGEALLLLRWSSDSLATQVMEFRRRYQNESETNANSSKALTIHELDEGIFYWYVNCTDTDGNSNISETRTLTVNAAPPGISIHSPDNNTWDIDGYNDFNFSVSGRTSTYSCSLLIDGTTSQTNSNVLNNTPTIFTEGNIEAGQHNWSIQCTDGYGKSTSTETRIISVDETSPIVQSITITPNTVNNTGDINVTAVVTDNLGVNSVNVIIENSSYSMSNQGNNVYYREITFGSNHPVLVPDVYVANVTATDNAGNNGSLTGNFTTRYNSITIDCGASDDYAYDSSRGYGYLDGSTSNEVRYDTDGNVSYLFTHLWPNDDYYFKLTFTNPFGEGGVQEIWLDDEYSGFNVTLSGTQYVYVRPKKSLYADRNITLRILRSSIGKTLIERIQFYRFQPTGSVSIDCGTSSDYSYSQSSGYGYLDGSPYNAWGNLSYQTVRYDTDGVVRYQFDNLDPLENYSLNLTFYEGDGAGRIEDVYIDSNPGTGYTCNDSPQGCEWDATYWCIESGTSTCEQFCGFCVNETQCEDSSADCDWWSSQDTCISDDDDYDCDEYCGACEQTTTSYRVDLSDGSVHYKYIDVPLERYYDLSITLYVDRVGSGDVVVSYIDLYSTVVSTTTTTTTTSTSTTTTTTSSTSTTSTTTLAVGVTLNSPSNGTVDYDGNVFLVYTPSSTTPIPNCTLYTNKTVSWNVSGSDNTIDNRKRNSFTLLSVPNGAYLWNVECIINDSYPIMASENWSFSVNNTALESYSTQVNASSEEPAAVDYSPANVSIRVVTNESISNAYLSISQHNSSTREANLSVSALNKYITIEADSELENSITSILLKIYYTEEEVNQSGIAESNLSMYRYNEDSSRWEQLLNTTTWVYGTDVNVDDDYVWANVTHFSDYTIAQSNPLSTSTSELITGWNLISLPLTMS